MSVEIGLTMAIVRNIDAVLITCPDVPYSSKTACSNTSMSVGNMKCTVIYDDTFNLTL